ncbi:mitochondrial intermediate peptidase [Condylostylus longicornis]|uniref:mitochondrial intermediate peptidase n=1 Tax=Condylostylus longicornis TaxID=2530218 RepID=UPI00244DC7AD|nr:mitochondrial intermediate peptidase [Condylostylus longicornis]
MINFYKIKTGIRINFHEIGITLRNLSTWSPLATTFNSPPPKKLNITKSNTGVFNIKQLRTPEGFYLLQEDVISKTENLVDEAVSLNRKRKLVEIFDELSDSLCKVADLAEFIRLSHPDHKYSDAATQACITVSGLVEKLNVHKELFQALQYVVNNGDLMKTSAIDQHVAKLFLFDFEQSGIHLEESYRKKVVEINEAILQIGQKFMDGAVHPRSIMKSLLPEDIRKHFPVEGDKIYVSGLYTDSSSSVAREAAYRLFLYPDHNQEKLLEDLIKYRYILATICGFDTYADRALKASTVENPSAVNSFLDELSLSIRSRSEKEFNLMEKIKKSNSGLPNAKLAAWDTPYFTMLMKRKWLQGSIEDFNPFFSLGSCMDGLSLLMHSLYGITLETVPMEPGEDWTDLLYKLAVVHESEGLLGYIYCDFFERPNKPNQDCHFTIQGGKKLNDGSYQMPIVVVMLNLRQHRWNATALLNPSMVDNLFHEMGHAMHSMLARTEYQHVTGTRCSTDFAEVPSVLMEYFASDPRVLRTFAKHFQTKEPMPEEMIQRLCASKNLFMASETELQIFYSALDQRYHGLPEQQKSTTTETLKEVQQQFYTLPYVENTAWQLRFSHLVGYGAKYYSYLLSRAVASWIWQTYFSADPFSREAGEKYRKECLSHGGGIPSKQLIEGFLGKEVNPKTLSESLIREIDNNNEHMQKMSKELNINLTN